MAYSDRVGEKIPLSKTIRIGGEDLDYIIMAEPTLDQLPLIDGLELGIVVQEGEKVTLSLQNFGTPLKNLVMIFGGLKPDELKQIPMRDAGALLSFFFGSAGLSLGTGETK